MDLKLSHLIGQLQLQLKWSKAKEEDHDWVQHKSHTCLQQHFDLSGRTVWTGISRGLFFAGLRHREFISEVIFCNWSISEAVALPEVWQARWS